MKKIFSFCKRYLLMYKRRLYINLQSRLGFALNKDFISRLQRAPLKFTQHLDTAYLNQRINNDVNALITFCIGIIQNVFVNIVTMVFSLVLLFVFHPLLAGILLGVAVIYFVFYVFYKQVLYRATLTDIIMGLQAGRFTGSVLYSGVSMDNADMYTMRNQLMGVSEQEPILLADTLMYNLRLDKNDFEPDAPVVNRLIKILGLEAYFNSLQNGFDTVINENAANISGGEKQKLSIMRALLKNPDILVLDEPTSALDTISKHALKGYLNEIKKNKIIIIITHDKDFVDDAEDVVYRIKS